jgi:hypothetical protein
MKGLAKLNQNFIGCDPGLRGQRGVERGSLLVGTLPSLLDGNGVKHDFLSVIEGTRSQTHPQFIHYIFHSCLCLFYKLHSHILSSIPWFQHGPWPMPAP